MKDEIVLREQAVKLYMQDIPVVEIANKLSKSRQWVHKWINRYKSGKPDWHVSLSNAPVKNARAIPKDIEKTIVSIRLSLKGQKYAQKGALGILYEFERLNMTPPSISTINRVLKRNGLIETGTIRDAKKKIIPFCSQTSSKWISWDQSILEADFDITY